MLANFYDPDIISANLRCVRRAFDYVLDCLYQHKNPLQSTNRIKHAIARQVEKIALG